MIKGLLGNLDNIALRMVSLSPKPLLSIVGGKKQL